MLAAWFLILLVSWDEPPVLLGPYTHSECQDVLEYLTARDYQTSECAWLPLPQEAIFETIPFLP